MKTYVDVFNSLVQKEKIISDEIQKYIDRVLNETDLSKISDREISEGNMLEMEAALDEMILSGHKMELIYCALSSLNIVVDPKTIYI